MRINHRVARTRPELREDLDYFALRCCAVTDIIYLYSMTIRIEAKRRCIVAKLVDLGCSNLNNANANVHCII